MTPISTDPIKKTKELPVSRRLRSRGLFVLLLLWCGPALAGPYTDDLSKCLVESTTKDDRESLVVWMFTAASAHPAVRAFSKVTEEQLESANEKMGLLIMRLLTESCLTQTKKALKFEGAPTLQASFQVLGQVAAQELFSSPQVSSAMSGMEKYVDEGKLKSLTEGD
jgi:hypothetical protein